MMPSGNQTLVMKKRYTQKKTKSMKGQVPTPLIANKVARRGTRWVESTRKYGEAVNGDRRQT